MRYLWALKKQFSVCYERQSDRYLLNLTNSGYIFIVFNFDHWAWVRANIALQKRKKNAFPGPNQIFFKRWVQICKTLFDCSYSLNWRHSKECKVINGPFWAVSECCGSEFLKKRFRFWALRKRWSGSNTLQKNGESDPTHEKNAYPVFKYLKRVIYLKSVAFGSQ